jgi:ATP-dependent Clp protease ATP-binding subunit ClpB
MLDMKKVVSSLGRIQEGKRHIGASQKGIVLQMQAKRLYFLLLSGTQGRSLESFLLQLFDEGHLTDSHGRKVDCRNVIVVMTSNLGAHVIAELPPDMKGTEPQVQESIMDIVRHTLSPELLNCIDEAIVFNRLQREDLHRIVEISIRDIANRLESAESGQNKKVK